MPEHGYSFQHCPIDPTRTASPNWSGILHTQQMSVMLAHPIIYLLASYTAHPLPSGITLTLQ